MNGGGGNGGFGFGTGPPGPPQGNGGSWNGGQGGQGGWNGNGMGGWNGGNGGGSGGWSNGSMGGPGGWNNGNGGGWNNGNGANWNNGGGGNWSNNGSGGGGWQRKVPKCYNCGLFGHISRECQAQRQHNQGVQIHNQGPHMNEGSSSSNACGETEKTAVLSKDVEESLKSMAAFVRRQAEKEEEERQQKKEAEEKRKKAEEERTTREEANRLALEKKKAKELKEAKRNWEFKKMLAKQKEAMELDFEKRLENRLKGLMITERVVKAKAKMATPEPESSEDEEEEEETQEERLEKRKRQQGQTSGTHASPAGTPTKMGRPSIGDTMAHVVQERDDQTNLQATKGKSKTRHESSLWEGAPVDVDNKTEVAFKKQTRKFLNKKSVPTIQEMCREWGMTYRERPEAVDELIDLRVMHFYKVPRTPCQGGIVIREQPASVTRGPKTPLIEHRDPSDE
ncbi:hypothetical protein CBR_g53763 [Chara braunii]|uniref:CCHC-type domain-containing protein n=1 Tax=Chara braunii TaxID=69332 RepID=A0A388K6W2_CHABU|nr:hypothetical protein CBR_g53763 [Chara braunii]|eukprot:GBG65794.1 hypothetical protein CBR_g53763 [Chara braunii]